MPICPHSQDSGFAPGHELSEAWPCTFQALHKGGCTTPAFPFQAADISGGVTAAPLSQGGRRPRCARLPPWNFLRHCLSVAQNGLLAGERQECEQRGESQNISSKPLSSCAIIFCSLFSPLFLLQINSREKLKTPQLTMRRGGKGKKPAAG